MASLGMQNWLKSALRRWSLAVGIVVAIALGGWWLLGKDSTQSSLSFGEAETAEQFAALDCQARYFDSSPALALMFAAPVDGRQNLSKVLSVLDLGASGDEGKGRVKRQTNPPAAASVTGADNTGADKDKDKIKAVNTVWIVGDNPRVLYLPHVKPKHRYRVSLSAELQSSNKEKLGQNLSCDIIAEAMPPSFYFASRGTVLPAKQNGGLPIVTVNVPEVDVQFLRVEPAQLPRFLERVVGRRSKNDAAIRQDEDEEQYYYDDRPRAPQGAVQGYQLDTLRSVSKSVYVGRFVADARENRRNITHLPVEDIKELQEPGIYIAVMNEPGRFRPDYQTTYFYVSDIGIHVRRSANSLDAFAISLKSGKALPGVEFQLLDENGKSLGKAAVDGYGHAIFSIKTSVARVITAKRGDEFSLLSLIEPALDLSEFNTGGHLPRATKIYAYAGRDLYRPGEIFEASILVRDGDGNLLPPAPITATLKRADGKTVQQFTVRPDDKRAGFLQHAILLPQDAQTGSWALELRADPGAKAPDSVMKFQVEEFLPERMKLDLKSKKASLALGEDMMVQVQGNYLYGAPAAGNKLMGTATTERNRMPFAKEWPGFEFGDFADDSLKKREDIASTNLNDNGNAEIVIATPTKIAERTSSPLSVRATLSLLESGGRPVVRTIERTMFPAEKLIGLRPTWSGKFVREGSNAEFEVIRVDREGKFAPLSKALLRVYREDRDYYWVFDDQHGWHSGFNEEDELIDSREFDLGKRTKVFFPVKYGRYRIEVVDRETGNATRYRLYAGWGAQDAESAGNRPDRVALKLDKPGYSEGESAKLSISPPHAGEALVLVEGASGVLWKKLVSVSAQGTTLSLPIDKAWNRHDLYVSAVVFRPGSRSEKVTPARAMGITYLPIDSEARKLAVKLDAPQKTQPDSALKIKVKAEGLKGEMATVTLSAVDVGILNITNFASPDAFDFFLGKQRYMPDVLDLYGKFIETVEGQKGKLKFGGDAKAPESKSSPKKVKLVDLYSGPVTLNAKGEAEITLSIPDFNGTLRLMATVVGSKQFGRAEMEVISAAPIVAELAMPRFVSPGDKATIALDVTNMTAEAQTVRVSVTSVGPIRVSGATEALQLKPQQKKTLHLSAEALDASGQGILTVMVNNTDKSAPIKIKREAVLAISPLAPAERTRRYQRVAPGETVKLDAGLTEGLHAGSALATATLSTTPPINVADQVRGLLGYPYGCLEQTTSKAFPHLLIDEKLAAAFGLKPFGKAERERAMDQTFSRLAGLQRSSGAFTLWGEGPDEPWLTAYVADFLKTARDQGYAVPDAMVKRADEWMQKQLQQAGTSFPPKPGAKKPDSKALPDDSITRNQYWSRDYAARELASTGHRRLGALAYMGYVLARDEKAPLAALRILHDEYRDRALSPLPMTHLSIALKRMGDEKRSVSALDDAFATPYGITGYEWEWLGDYGTQLRDTALSFSLLERHKVAHKRKDNLLNELVQLVPRALWLSTQEQMALLLVAKEFSGSGGSGKDSEWRATITSAGKDVTLQSRNSEMREFNADALKRGVAITNNHSEPIYLATETVGFALKPREPKDDLIALRRTLYEADGSLVGNRVLKVGEQLLVHLEVNAKRRIVDGLVVDRVPAGLEIENTNITQNGGANPLASFKITPHKDTRYGRRNEINPAEAMADTRIKHREFRDDRFVAAARLENTLDLFYLVRVVTPGQFVIPPSFAEDMYRPEVRGMSAAGGVMLVEGKR